MNKILLVEDEKDILENIEILLDAEGYNVVTACNGLEALKKLNQYTPDLIISDIMMPYLDGFELFQHVKEDSKTKIIPFIFLTAKSELSSIRRGMNLGADDYITKPYKSEDLLRAIKIRLKRQEIINEQIDDIRNSISMYVPHELRTPLTAILGYSDIILSDGESMEKSDIINMTERISYSAKRLYNRIEKFIHLIDLEPISLIELQDESFRSEIDDAEVMAIVNEHQILSERKDDLKLSVEPAVIKISNFYLQIVLRELLENSVKFSHQNTFINICGKEEDNFYKLEIEDYGIGMTENEISRIGTFQQFDRNIYQQEGNGLGMVLVKRILHSISGEFKITSVKSKYTKVIMKIPLI